jgi:hypothetical protein
MGGGNGQLVFSYSNYPTCKLIPNLPQGKYVLVSNSDFTNALPVKTLITNGIVHVQSVSPDGTKIIISTSFDELGNGPGYLSLVDLQSNAGLVTIAPYIYVNAYYGFPVAFWVDNSRLVYMGLYGGVYSILMVNSDGTNLKRISKPDPNVFPTRILYADESGIYWSSSSSPNDFISSAKIWWSSIDGSQQKEIIINGFDPSSTWQDSSSWYDYQISPDGKWILWLNNPGEVYIGSLSNLNEGSKFIGRLPYPVYSILFSTDSNKAILLPTYGSETSYQGKYFPSYNNFPIYTVSFDNFELNKLFVPKYDERMDFSNASPLYEALSPDGRLILINTFVIDHEKNRVTASKAILINLETQATSEFDSSCIRSYIHWLPTIK